MDENDETETMIVEIELWQLHVIASGIMMENDVIGKTGDISAYGLASLLHQRKSGNFRLVFNVKDKR